MCTTNVASLPRDVYIEVTNLCNLACTTCPRTFFQWEKRRHMTVQEFTQLVNQFDKVDRFVLHGLGEPLLHPSIAVLVSLAKSRAKKVLFNTNGLLLTPKLGDILIKAGLDELRVSVDAPDPKIYPQVRKTGQLRQVYENVKTFVTKARKKKTSFTKVSFWMTAGADRVNLLPKLVRDAAELGVEEVYLQRLIAFGRGDATTDNLFYSNPTTQVRKALQEAAKTAKETGVRLWGSGDESAEKQLRSGESNTPWKKCKRPFVSTYVSATGLVLPCCLSPFTAPDKIAECVLGNAFEKPFQQIWRSRSYENFRRQFLSDNPPPCCKNCGTLWSL